MTVADLLAWCISFGACSEALTWLASLDQDAPAETARQSCGCGEWMLWLAELAGCPRRLLVLADVRIIETLIPDADAEVSAILVECCAAYRAWCADPTPEAEARADRAARSPESDRNSRRNALGFFDAIDRQLADLVRSVISWSDLEMLR